MKKKEFYKFISLWIKKKKKISIQGSKQQKILYTTIW